jgi:hypothetical protein
MNQKPELVKIISITSSRTEDGMLYFYGLGDDEKIYVMDYETKIWSYWLG